MMVTTRGVGKSSNRRIPNRTLRVKIARPLTNDNMVGK